MKSPLKRLFGSYMQKYYFLSFQASLENFRYYVENKHQFLWGKSQLNFTQHDLPSHLIQFHAA